MEKNNFDYVLTYSKNILPLNIEKQTAIPEKLQQSRANNFTILFMNSFEKNAEAQVEISDLISLGWSFDEKDYTGYHAVVRVYENGKTTYQIINTEKLNNKILEGGDEENTGDDEATINDLNTLQKEGKLWDVKFDVEWL